VDTSEQVTRKLSRRGFIGLALGAVAGAHPLARTLGKAGAARESLPVLVYADAHVPAYDSLMCSLANPTPILDNLGITINLDDAMRRYAGALDVPPTSLTEKQRREAALAAYLTT